MALTQVLVCCLLLSLLTITPGDGRSVGEPDEDDLNSGDRGGERGGSSGGRSSGGRSSGGRSSGGRSKSKTVAPTPAEVTPTAPRTHKGITPTTPGYGKGVTPTTPGYGKGITPTTHRNGKGVTPTHRKGKGVTPSSPRNGKGVTHIPRNGKGVTHTPHKGKGVTHTPRKGKGVTQTPRRGKGVTPTPRNGKGVTPASKTKNTKSGKEDRNPDRRNTRNACYCNDDAHCKTLDAVEFDFMGTCSYIFLQDGCINGLPSGVVSFKIVLDFWDRNKPPASWVKAGTICIGNMTIVVGIGLYITINGVQIHTFPVYPGNGVIIQRTDSALFVNTDFGLSITYNGEERRVMFKAYLTDDLMTQTCGLCGNYNGDPGDDFIMGPFECPADPRFLPGEVAETTNIFGESWLESFDSDARCIDKTESCKRVDDAPPRCDPSTQVTTETLCDALIMPDGRFQHCIAAISLEDLETLYSTCVLDGCTDIAGAHLYMCAQAANLIDICWNQYGVILTGWRDEQFCPMECPEKMVYDSCGSSCQPSCADPTGSECDPLEPCQEGCYCEDGFLWDGNNCINQDQCGCVRDGYSYQVGESIIAVDCSYVCSCIGQEDIVCVDMGCPDDNTHCTVIDGARGCFCQDGYSLVEGHCIAPEREADGVGRCVCEVAGDPVITFYDGHHILELEGTGDYLLSKLTGERCQFKVTMRVSTEEQGDRIRIVSLATLWLRDVDLAGEESYGFNPTDVISPFGGASISQLNSTGNRHDVTFLNPDCSGFKFTFLISGIGTVIQINIPSGQTGYSVVGLCGNCDGIDNDYKTLDNHTVDVTSFGWQRLMADSFLLH